MTHIWLLSSTLLQFLPDTRTTNWQIQSHSANCLSKYVPCQDRMGSGLGQSQFFSLLWWGKSPAGYFGSHYHVLLQKLTEPEFRVNTHSFHERSNKLVYSPSSPLSAPAFPVYVLWIYLSGCSEWCPHTDRKASCSAQLCVTGRFGYRPCKNALGALTQDCLQNTHSFIIASIQIYCKPCIV